MPVPLSNSTVPWGLKSSAFWVVPSRLPLISIVLPGAEQNAGAVDGQAALEIERRTESNPKRALINEFAGLDSVRARREGESKARRQRKISC